MRSTLIAVAAVAVALALPIAAQAAPNAAQAAPNAAQPTQSRHITGHTLAADLKKAGFTNVRVRPVAFVARATDRNGRLVLMAFRPNSFTAVTQLRAAPTSNNGTNNQNNNQSNDSNATK